MQGAITIPTILYKLKIIRELNLAAIHLFEMHPGNFVLTACCSVSAEYCSCVKNRLHLEFHFRKEKEVAWN